jgi:LAO/AO transport system kinase
MISAEKILAGERLSLARLLSQIENRQEQGRAILEQLYPHTGQAHVVGVTGPTGAGKSSLVNQLIKTLLDMGAAPKIGVLAVDPSSPFSGGAILGDRVRMRAIAADARIFMRSMASRGALGGLAYTTLEMALAMDAAGYGIIVVETVGAGQSEVQIASLAHTTILVEAPGLGDDIQTAKAGILEIADILALNKADRPGVDATEQALRIMLELGYGHLTEKQKETVWVPPLLRTIATDGQGINALAIQVLAHRTFLEKSSAWQQCNQKRMETFVRQLLDEHLRSRWQLQEQDEKYQRMLTQVLDREISPYQAIDRFFKD